MYSMKRGQNDDHDDGDGDVGDEDDDDLLLGMGGGQHGEQDRGEGEQRAEKRFWRFCEVFKLSLHEIMFQKFESQKAWHFNQTRQMMK